MLQCSCNHSDIYVYEQVLFAGCRRLGHLATALSQCVEISMLCVCPQDDDDDDDDLGLDTSREFFCDEIVAEGLPLGDGIPTEVSR